MMSALMATTALVAAGASPQEVKKLLIDLLKYLPTTFKIRLSIQKRCFEGIRNLPCNGNYFCRVQLF